MFSFEELRNQDNIRKAQIAAMFKISSLDNIISKGFDPSVNEYGDMQKAKETTEKHKKVHKVMSEYKSGKLKSSSGDKVKDRKQALAIAMSEAGISKSEEDMCMKAFDKAEYDQPMMEQANTME